MIEVRRPAEHEIADLAQMDYEIFGEHSYAQITMRQFYDLAGPLLNVATDSSKLVGYSLILPTFASNEGWFLALGVRETYRRSGIGRVLSRRALEEADRLSISTLRLTVEPGNNAAIALYAALGFQTEGITADYFGEREDRQIMRRVRNAS
ncbi:GNAT family N-acetyltransferase [Couchioplanes azureus]|uniref:GNAT family N-acetyltransferase n=1 Tax=Couchioplanes caeruleus TaxID=56438 RepID=UPI00166FFCA1|nr:GNAT family N-acetyltransferase [Couchioplanes caeruleus]GGQ67147.1 N-acetyltransferase [Couchioplanes caeruleus subsp. azureus]